jgi:hypothetical protein
MARLADAHAVVLDHDLHEHLVLLSLQSLLVHLPRLLLLHLVCRLESGCTTAVSRRAVVAKDHIGAVRRVRDRLSRVRIRAPLLFRRAATHRIVSELRSLQSVQEGIPATVRLIKLLLGTEDSSGDARSIGPAVSVRSIC